MAMLTGIVRSESRRKLAFPHPHQWERVGACPGLDPGVRAKRFERCDALSNSCEIADRDLSRRRGDDYKLPLVLGTCPAARGSSSTDIRNARPKALKTVSHW